MVLPQRGGTRKLSYSVGFYFNQCKIYFYDQFAKYRNLAKTIASGKMVVDGLAKGEKNFCDYDVSKSL